MNEATRQQDNKTTRQQDNKTKRLLSMLLAAMMLVSMFSINVSAEMSAYDPITHTLDLQNSGLTDDNFVETLSDYESIFNDVWILKVSYNNGIKNLNPALIRLPNLTKIYANNCKINDLSGFNTYGNNTIITRLELSNNKIIDVTPLGNLGYAILKLYLNNNLITNLKPLVFMPDTVTSGMNYQYNYLDLSNNNISDTVFFSQMYFLTAALKISNNYLTGQSITFHGSANITNSSQNSLPTNPADLYVMDEENNDTVLSYFGHETDVEIPASLGATTIDFRAFKDNRFLETLKIPDAVTTIGYGAFDSCLNLKRVDFGTGLTQIDSMAFNYCYSLLGAALPDSIQTVSENAFRKCYRLKNVCFSNPNTAVDNEAFHYCDPNLLTINVNPDVPSGSTLMNSVNNLINDSATIVSFSNITTDFTVTDGVLTACTDDNSKLVLPNGIQSVNVSSFSTPSNLDSVIIPEGVTSLNLPINVGTNALSVLLPNTLESVGSFVNSTADLTVYSKAANTVAAQYVASSTGFDLNTDYDISYDTLNSYTGTGVTTLTIPSNLNIDIIGASAFFNKASLTDIILPNGISEIETLAFRKCYALTNLDLNDDGSLKVISSLAISDCNALEDIEIPESAQILGAYALESCNLLETVSFGTESELIDIGVGAFLNCPTLNNNSSNNVDMFTLPKNLEKLETSVFQNCTGLVSVSLPASFTEENQVDINAFAFCDDSLIIYCTEFKPDAPSQHTNLWNLLVEEDFNVSSLINSSNNSQSAINFRMLTTNTSFNTDNIDQYMHKQSIINKVTTELLDNSSSEINVNELTEQIAVNMLLAEH